MRIPIYYVIKQSTIVGEEPLQKVYVHFRRAKCNEYLNSLPKEERAMCGIGRIYLREYLLFRLGEVK